MQRPVFTDRVTQQQIEHRSRRVTQLAIAMNHRAGLIHQEAAREWCDSVAQSVHALAGMGERSEEITDYRPPLSLLGVHQVCIRPDVRRASATVRLPRLWATSVIDLTTSRSVAF